MEFYDEAKRPRGDLLRRQPLVLVQPLEAAYACADGLSAVVLDSLHRTVPSKP